MGEDSETPKRGEEDPAHIESVTVLLGTDGVVYVKDLHSGRNAARMMMTLSAALDFLEREVVAMSVSQRLKASRVGLILPGRDA